MVVMEKYIIHIYGEHVTLCLGILQIKNVENSET